MMQEGPVRWVALEGAHNMRDLGGFDTALGRTRSGQVFRSDALECLSPTDVDLLTKVYGVRQVLDLRSTEERREAGDGPLAKAGVRHDYLVVIDGDDLERRRSARANAVAVGQEPDDIMAEGNGELLRYGRVAFAAALERLVEPEGLPAIVHCSAGKDRTGVLTALLLELVGVSDADIAADYAATASRLPMIIERLQGATGFTAMSAQLPAFVLDARAGTMRRFLARLRADFGGAAGYFAECGVGVATIERWRTVFTAPRDPREGAWIDPLTAA